MAQVSVRRPPASRWNPARRAALLTRTSRPRALDGGGHHALCPPAARRPGRPACRRRLTRPRRPPGRRRAGGEDDVGAQRAAQPRRPQATGRTVMRMVSHRGLAPSIIRRTCPTIPGWRALPRDSRRAAVFLISRLSPARSSGSRPLENRAGSVGRPCLAIGTVDQVASKSQAKIGTDGARRLTPQVGGAHGAARDGDDVPPLHHGDDHRPMVMY